PGPRAPGAGRPVLCALGWNTQTLVEEFFLHPVAHFLHAALHPPGEGPAQQRTGEGGDQQKPQCSGDEPGNDQHDATGHEHQGVEHTLAWVLPGAHRLLGLLQNTSEGSSAVPQHGHAQGHEGDQGRHRPQGTDLASDHDHQPHFEERQCHQHQHCQQRHRANHPISGWAGWSPYRRQRFRGPEGSLSKMLVCLDRFLLTTATSSAASPRPVRAVSGTAPMRVATVGPSTPSTSATWMSASASGDRWVTEPSLSTTALTPLVDTTTAGRPCSTARNWVMANCWSVWPVKW